MNLPCTYPYFRYETSCYKTNDHTLNRQMEYYTTNLFGGVYIGLSSAEEKKGL